MNTVGLHLAIEKFHLKLVQKIDPIWSNITSKLINQSYSKTLWFSSPRCPSLRLLNHNSLCGQNHSCNRSRILQTTSRHLFMLKSFSIKVYIVRFTLKSLRFT
ncbi:hypothetical protein HanXRQr2_Chr01g0037681 [Helianthus annuus]|uniref:Uncharacterized protein n=1 Tax=Helianthus annuus TaxID=4232 RepID=A0A9K3JYK7_HELAN|nr:hypothetical protein HanXRQr2_Chr01g0037681 [Helianthus annuus]KAJ0958182.1 hypothetical protein HanPSC8_Chr01g0036161 [Helianthus annuus]